jgi:polycomb protein EED
LEYPVLIGSNILASFKIISALSFPQVPNQLVAHSMKIFVTTSGHPLAVLSCPHFDVITILNLSQMPLLKPPPFSAPITTLSDQARQINLTEEKALTGQSIRVIPRLSGWDLQVPISNGEKGNLGVTVCGMGMGGKLIVGVGSDGRLWVWGRTTVRP